MIDNEIVSKIAEELEKDKILPKEEKRSADFWCGFLQALISQRFVHTYSEFYSTVGPWQQVK